MKAFVRLFAWVLLFAPLAVYTAEASPKVDVFVTEWCPYCRELESFLKKNRIDYTRHNVEEDPKSAERFFELGGQGVPLATVGARVIRGYDPEELMAAIEADGKKAGS